MTWKHWLAMVAPWVGIIAVLLVSRSCQKDWEAKDVERVEEIGRYVFLAKGASDRAASAASEASSATRRAEAAEAELEKLKGQLQPSPHEVCRVPIARRDRIIKKQEEQINIHKATQEMLWTVRENDLEEIKNLRTALELQGDRAEGWKKSAKNNRRDKILIGTFSAIGGGAVVALGVWGAGQL